VTSRDRANAAKRSAGRALGLGVLKPAALLLLLLSVPATVAQAQGGNPPGKHRKVSRTPQPDATDRAALAQFHRNLESLAAGRRDVLQILQIGDSHTGADHLSGRLRSLLQQRFGDAGRGFLPAGAPHAWYRPYQVAVTQSPGWRTLTSNKLNPDPAEYGLSGIVARTTLPGETIVIEMRTASPLKAIDVGLVMQPGGGTLEVLADGAVLATLSTAGDAGRQTVRLSAPREARHIELRTLGDGPVEIADHALVGAARGVVLSNVGFIGAQVSIMGRWSPSRLRADIAALDPALIILAFGTNEGHAPAAGIEARYAAQFEAQLAAIRSAAPGASLVVIGPPDANRYPRYCFPKRAPEPAPPPPAPEAKRADDPPSAVSATPTPPPAAASEPSKVAQPKPSPPPEPPEATPCRPLTAEERSAYDRMIAAEDRALCRWHTPAAFPLVRRIQRETAARHGALFFDWYELFESECGADRWFRAGLAHKDRVHFKQEGYWRAADRLYARLMAGASLGQPPAAQPLPAR
jgi:lysophospholipase L1-like esterase